MPDDAVYNLREAAVNDSIFKERLLQEYGDELEEDEVALFDTLDGISDFTEAVDVALQALSEHEAMADAIKARAKDLSARASRYEAKVERIRQVLTWALQRTGRKKVEVKEGTVSLRNNSPKLDIYNERHTPVKYWRIEYKIDKELLKNDLKAGLKIDGARFLDGTQSIAIRRS